jgi:uncharacterized zinc-type alcohol dehydrogenase-like protein
MIKTVGYAAHNATNNLEPFTFERRELSAEDVLIEILYCGICHSDIHQVRNEWKNSTYPMVPGHEIVGKVTKVGSNVTKFTEGDIAGVGCMVDSCRKCANCKEGVEQFCQKHVAYTYNSTEMDEKTPTYGGYSSHIVVDQAFALKVSSTQPLSGVAPLLCAGITTYSPLKKYIKPGDKVGIVGLGGLGHMGVKLAVAMGAEVTVFSTSLSKKDDAQKLGAHHFVSSKDSENFASLVNKFDFILDTVSANHDLNLYLQLLKLNGVMVLVGAPEEAAKVEAFALLRNNRSLAGSSIGGIKETQEMLDFCAEKNIVSEVEVISINQLDEAYSRTIKSDVKYRFVIDLQTLPKIS